MRNGASFSHPAAVSSVLGVFTFVALLASFFTAIYGVSVPNIRTHYAHSLSVLVVFEVFQSIFFSSALSLNWPSVCAAWWSNFAWSAGQIYTTSVINSINSFTGVSGNSSQVGGAGSTIINNNGGLQQQIYGRALGNFDYAKSGEEVASHIYKRALNETTSSRLYAWAGVPVSPGLPLPGNWTSFAGELSLLSIPAADAFTLGLVWFIILVVILVAATILFKWSLEALSSVKLIKQDRLALFRTHWLGFTGLVVLRSCIIAFFMMMTLTMFQFSYGGRAGPIAIAAIFFMLFFIGALGIAFYACFYRIRFGQYKSSPDRIHLQRSKVMKFVPWYRAVRESSLEEDDKSKSAGSVSFFQVNFIGSDAEGQSIHDNVEYTKRFGWLSSRFRRTRWWFFTVWIVYQFVRACFVGGARANPTAQVFGLFVWEVLAFIAIVWINPFEGSRNTALAVYMLGISKVATAGLSIAFLPQYNVARIPTTVIGVIIIVIQGFLVIGLLILIVLGAISTYMSLTRNREEFSPRNLEDIRTKYFGHLVQKEKDIPAPPPPEPEEPKEPYFSVTNVRRAPKIEDEDVDYVGDKTDFNPADSTASVAIAPLTNRASRSNSLAANSMRSYQSHSNIPYGARVHRASWSSRDFQNFQQDETNRGDSNSSFGTPSRVPSASAHGATRSLTKASIVKPSASQTNMRPSTSTRELKN